MELYGRRKIYTSVEEITEQNVVSVLTDAMSYHLQNISEENYLYWYRRGNQPILQRTREVRDELTKHVVVNNANQIVTFKNGYFMISGTSYTSKDDAKVNDVKRLNDYCFAGGKQLADNQIIDWFHTVGLGVMYVDIDREGKERCPFHCYSLDPRSAFVVYSYRPGNRPVFGVNVVLQDQTVMFDVITETTHFVLRGGMTGGQTLTDVVSNKVATPISVVSQDANIIGKIPIIEWQYDINRMSSFESALGICDELNELQTQLAESVEQQIQQLFVAYNCNFDDGTTANDIRKSGMLVLKSLNDNAARVDLLETKLSQSELQVSIDALYEQLLDKAGLPSIDRSSGGSSDNGSAVYLKSGYTIADTNRRNTEDLWRESDFRFREVVLAILQNRFSDFTLEAEDFDIEIEPPMMSNLLVKTQSALNMRKLGLHPQIWLERSGLSNDPISDIELSKDYIYKFYEESEQKQEAIPQDNENAEQAEAEGEPLADEEQAEEVPSKEVD